MPERQILGRTMSGKPLGVDPPPSPKLAVAGPVDPATDPRRPLSAFAGCYIGPGGPSPGSPDALRAQNTPWPDEG